MPKDTKTKKRDAAPMSSSAPVSAASSWAPQEWNREFADVLSREELSAEARYRFLEALLLDVHKRCSGIPLAHVLEQFVTTFRGYIGRQRVVKVEILRIFWRFRGKRRQIESGAPLSTRWPFHQPRSLFTSVHVTRSFRCFFIFATRTLLSSSLPISSF
jgi:hypothetical protein